MKKSVKFSIVLIALCSLPIPSAYGIDSRAHAGLWNLYEHHCNMSSDINEHIPVLRRFAAECSSVIEIGIREMVSTWGILQGLSESPSPSRSYLGIDLAFPPLENLSLAKNLSKKNGISFRFQKDNDLYIDLPYADMLFIDSLHTYRHLTYELEKFSPKIRKYIAMHDTSEPWGDLDETPYIPIDESAYPSNIDTNKRGLWQAVQDFLERHPEWILQERHLNNHGFTVLKRIH
jgi:hypothetical protein